MPNHSCHPWRIARPENGAIEIQDWYQSPVCTLSEADPYREYDARVIEQAPELRRALVLLLQTYGNTKGASGDPAVIRAREALLKTEVQPWEDV